MHVSQDDLYPQCLKVGVGGTVSEHLHVPQDDLYPQRLKQDTHLFNEKLPTDLKKVVTVKSTPPSPGGGGNLFPTGRSRSAALTGAGAAVAGKYAGRVHEFSAPTAALYKTPPSPTLSGLFCSL
jgi:hypothetical protein